MFRAYLIHMQGDRTLSRGWMTAVPRDSILDESVVQFSPE